MKFTRELKVGFSAIVGIILLVLGVNFLKGNSFFGGDLEYHSYFENSGQLAVSANVTLNGVIVGKVKKVMYVPNSNPKRRVKITFSINNSDVVLPKGTIIEIGSLDLFSKGILIKLSSDLSKGNYLPGASIPGRLSVDMISQVKAYADPIAQKLQGMMASIDKMVISLSAFWDTTATSEIEGSLKQVKLTIQKLGNVASEIEGFVKTERIQFSRIMENVAGITSNLQKSNEQITAILGNTKKITDDFVTADFKTVILDAQTTLKKLNIVLDEAGKGNGTLGKLIHDEKLYNELVETNNELQNLVSDIQIHPERYIHFSLTGRKSKGVPLSSKEERKLRNLLDSIPE